jgi:hypothetical protein
LTFRLLWHIRLILKACSLESARYSANDFDLQAAFPLVAFSLSAPFNLDWNGRTRAVRSGTIKWQSRSHYNTAGNCSLIGARRIERGTSASVVGPPDRIVPEF